MTIYILPFSAQDFDCLAPLLPFVSAGRRERIARMKNDTAKTASLLSALLVRMAVSERAGVPASELIFSAHEGGKPYCVGVPCEFSLSHTSGMIVCAVSDEPVGIDAELLRPAPMRVARRFTDAEREYISGSDERFFRVWTRKEAFGKMKGDGLSGGALGTDVLSHGFSASARTFRFGDHIISACGSVSSVAAAAAAAEDIYEYFIQGEI